MAWLDSAHVCTALVFFSGFCAASYAVHAYYFSSKLKPEQYSEAQARAETLRRSRWFYFASTIAQILLFYGLISASSIGHVKLFALSFFLFMVMLLIQSQIAFSVDKKIRGLAVGHSAALKQALRALIACSGMYGAYYALTFGTIGAGQKLITWLKLPSWISILGTPAAILVGLMGVFLASPLIIRLMLPCERVKDPEIERVLASCFGRAGLKAPTFWTIRLDHLKFHNAMVSGLRWGRGWFRPALFFSSSLLQHLDHDEFEAIMLHEVSHISLKHIPKRAIASLVAFVILLLPYIALAVTSAMILPPDYIVTANLVCFLFVMTGQIYLVRIVVRRQELEADENAVRLGARLEAFASGLSKLTTLNDQLKTKKDPSTLLNPSAAHPTPDERIQILRTRSSLGFPPRSSIWAEVLAAFRHRTKVLAPLAGAGAVLLVFGFFYLKPRADLRNAVFRGDLAAVQRLLDRGVGINSNDYLHSGTFPLYTAAGTGDLPIVKYLVQHGADVSQLHPREKRTALMEAASMGNADVVRYLMEHGAKVNARAARGNTALIFATAGGFTETAKVLLDHGASVNQRNDHGSTALTIASYYGKLPLVKLLIARGANVDVTDGDGDSSLGMAILRRHLDVAALLSRAGAKNLGRYKVPERAIAGKIELKAGSSRLKKKR